MEGFARSKARLVDSEWRASTTRARKSSTERAEESDLILLASGEASRRPPLHRSDSEAVERQTARIARNSEPTFSFFFTLPRDLNKESQEYHHTISAFAIYASWSLDSFFYLTSSYSALSLRKDFKCELKPLLNSYSDSEVRIFGCFLLDPCGSACCATSLNQTYPRRSSTRSTALAASCPVASDSAGSPSKQRAGAPTVPAPASTLAPFGLEDHQVPSKVLNPSLTLFWARFSWRSYISPEKKGGGIFILKSIHPKRKQGFHSARSE
ncbi:hypothetical protein AHAS_Ahas18G0078800 [Arachis hypogaea]